MAGKEPHRTPSEPMTAALPSLASQNQQINKSEQTLNHNGKSDEKATDSCRDYYMSMARQPGFNKIIHRLIFHDERRSNASASPHPVDDELD